MEPGASWRASVSGATEALLRWRYLLLGSLATLVWAASSTTLTPDNDWQFFTWGGDLLFEEPSDFRRSDVMIEGDQPGGLQTYANYPVLQIGPPALVLGHWLDVGPHGGAVLAGALVQALGLLAVYALERGIGRGDRRALPAVTFGGALLTIAWAGLTHYTHLDDALTLASGLCATWALTARRPLLAGALLGLAAAAKPWGVVLLPLVLALPGWRRRLGAASAALLVPIAVWLPFVLADARTLRLAEQPVALGLGSPLRALAVEAVSQPDRLRLAQLGLGLLVVVLLVAQGAWWLGPLAAFALRLSIDPGDHAYYGAAVVAAALLADLGSGIRRLPWFTLAAAGGWALAGAADPSTAGALTLTTYACLLSGVLLSARSRQTTARSSSSRC